MTGTSQEECAGSIIPALKLGGSVAPSSRPFQLAACVLGTGRKFCVDRIDERVTESSYGARETRRGGGGLLVRVWDEEERDVTTPGYIWSGRGGCGGFHGLGQIRFAREAKSRGWHQTATRPTVEKRAMPCWL